jgi:hypothetical protein
LPERCRAAALLASVAPYQAAGLDFLDGTDESNAVEFSVAVAGWQHRAMAELATVVSVSAGWVAETGVGRVLWSVRVLTILHDDHAAIMAALQRRASPQSRNPPPPRRGRRTDTPENRLY